MICCLIVASEDTKVQVSFQKLKTEYDELKGDFDLMCKIKEMTKNFKKSYEVMLVMLDVH